MAIALLSHEVCDLTLGKPSLAWLAASTSVRAALVALKQQEDVSEISVWDCSPASHTLIKSAAVNPTTCRCIGKVCMQKIICYLASDHSLCNVVAALDAPITVLLDEKSTCVQHIDPDASLQEALFAIVAGAQNLVVQITDPFKERGRVLGGSLSYNKKSMANSLVLKSHNGQEYCWLTHEDVLRFLLGSIGVFSSIAMMSIKDLGIIQTNVLMVGMDDEAISILDMIKAACSNAAAVAIVEKNEIDSTSCQMVGEISYSTFHMCNETAAIALAALSVRNFLAYIQDGPSTPDMLMEAMSAKLNKKLALSESDNEIRHVVSQMFHDFEMLELSSDDEFGADSPTGPHDLLRKHHMHFQSSVRFTRSHNGPILCRPTSSLIAVLMQALAHREHYVWVTNEDNTLVGMVTFADILSVLSNYLNLAC